MAQLIARGGVITLDAFYRDNTGTLTDPVSPQVSIIDANGDTVVSLVTPTRISTGFYQYEYSVAGDAMLGAWAIRWFGTIDGSGVEDEDGFTVVLSGSISTPLPGVIGVTCTPWATSEDALAPCNVYGVDTDLLDKTMQMASDILFELTGRRWPGACRETIRPMAQWRSYGVPKWWPPIDGMRGGMGWCSCHRIRETGCTRIPEIKLPGHPVDSSSIVVKIDGAEFFDFALHDGRYLARTDGDGWPCCQDLTLADSELHTFSITYGFGSGPPIGGALSAAHYGCQLALSLDPTAVADGRCMLPKRVTTITRQGITLAVLDPLTYVEKGLTGLATVDAWVASVNLGASRRRATVLVPGGNRSARRIT